MSDLQHKFRHWSYHRQHLGKQGTDLKQVLQDVVGVYSSHPSAALSLAARVQSFDEQAFYDLDQTQQAFRVPAMRESVYFLSAETAATVMAATIPPASDPYWAKRYGQQGRKIPAEHYAAWKQEIFRVTQQSQTAAEIKKVVNIPADNLKPVLNRMAFEGHLVRVGAKSLRSNIISYVATSAWAKDKFVQIDNDKALTWLAGEYLRAFGPARVKDFQWWAGITAAKAKTAISACETVTLAADYLLWAEDLAEFEAFEVPTQDTLVILPRWDSYSMGYAPDGRARFAHPDIQHHIYGKIGATGGNAFGVVLVNGLAHGSWQSRFKGKKMVVDLTMFETPTPQLQADIDHQFNEIASLLKAKEVLLALGSVQ